MSDRVNFTFPVSRYGDVPGVQAFIEYGPKLEEFELSYEEPRCYRELHLSIHRDAAERIFVELKEKLGY